MLVNGTGKKAEAAGFSGIGGASWIVKVPEVDALLLGLEAQVFDVDIGYPFPFELAPADATKSRHTPVLCGSVLPIQDASDCAQLTTPIVQLVPMDVVALGWITLTQAEQLAGHGHLIPTLPVTFGASSVSVRVQMPAPLVEPPSISSVNRGVGANRPISGVEGDLNGIIGLHWEAPLSGVAERAVTSGAAPFAFLHFTMLGGC